MNVVFYSLLAQNKNKYSRFYPENNLRAARRYNLKSSHLIAGTYTPFLLVSLPGNFRWVLFVIVWTIALAGVVFKIFFVNQFRVLSTILYILMGWLIIIVWGPLTTAIESTGIYLLVSGGLFYTLGVLFYMWHRIPYHHMIWHLFVLAGTTFHFFSIFYYVI